MMQTQSSPNHTARSEQSEESRAAELDSGNYYVVEKKTGRFVVGGFETVGEIPLRYMGFDGRHEIKREPLS